MEKDFTSICSSFLFFLFSIVLIRFTSDHHFEKPNDRNALMLMNRVLSFSIVVQSCSSVLMRYSRSMVTLCLVLEKYECSSIS